MENQVWTIGMDAASNDSDGLSSSDSLYNRYISYTLDVFATWIFPVLLIIASQKLWLKYTEYAGDTECVYPLPPGSMGLPFIGETLSLILKGSNYFTSKRKKYGNIFKTHLLGRPTIRIIGSENVRKILKGEHNLVSTQWPVSTQMIFGDGALALSSGLIHKERRKAIMRAFNQEALASYVLPIQRAVRDCLNRWCKSREVLAYPECKLLTFKIAASVLVGFDIPHADCLQLLDTFQEMSGNVFSLPINIPGSGLYKAMRAREAIISKLGEYLEETKVDRSQNSKKSFTSALELLAEGETKNGVEPNKRELLEAALELLFAGHETSSSAACSTMLHLAAKPSIVEKVCNELFDHGLLNENDGCDLTFDTINQLSYTNLVVREILRISPPVGGSFRRALKTFEIGGYQVPKDWTIVYSIRDTHQTSVAFEGIDEFDPDRWLAPPNDMAKNDFLPFGSGSRSCVGKEFAKLLLKIITVELVRNCSWWLVKGRTTISDLPVPHPNDDMPIRITEVSAYRRRSYTL